MKRVLLIYKSKYGSTKKYAEYIKENVGCDILNYDDFKKKDLNNYDLIVYGGGVHAGGISGFDTFEKVIKRNQDKDFLIFAVGMNLENFDQRAELRDVNFSKSYTKGLTCFFLNGDYNPNKVTGIDKKIMNFSRKVLLSKGVLNFNSNDKELLSRMDNGYEGYKNELADKVIEEIRERING